MAWLIPMMIIILCLFIYIRVRLIFAGGGGGGALEHYIFLRKHDVDTSVSIFPTSDLHNL